MEPDRQAKLKSYAWLTALAMLLALFVPLASAGAQDDGGPDGDTLSAQAVAEEGGTLDATPESMTNLVSEPHTITAKVDNGETTQTVVAAVEDADIEENTYEGGLPDGTSDECTIETDDEDDSCEVFLNDDEGPDAAVDPTPGKDRIRVWLENGDEEGWQEDEDFDWVTKTWVDEESEGDDIVLFGDDRIGTSVDISQDHWLAHDAAAPAEHAEDEHADAVVIARADDFPDALAGSPFATRVNGPLLLTFPDDLDERSEEELQRVLDEGGDVYLLGGNHALSQNVEDRIEELGYDVNRLFGDTRFETALDIADELETIQGGTLEHIFIARSHVFPDSLSGGAAAASVDTEGDVGAILLTHDTVKHDETDTFIEAREDDATTYALAGPNFNPYSCADEVQVDMDGDGDEETTWHTVSECEDEDDADLAIFGFDRHETARAIAEFFFAGPTDVGFARSDLFPDALTGGAHIGQHNGPILLTPTEALHQDAERYTCYTADTIETAYEYGGDHAIAADTRDQIDLAIDGDAEVCSPHDAPGHLVGS